MIKPVYSKNMVLMLKPVKNIPDYYTITKPVITPIYLISDASKNKSGYA